MILLTVLDTVLTK